MSDAERSTTGDDGAGPLWDDEPSQLTAHVSGTYSAIVVGSGIAGLYAALLLAGRGRVLLVTKAELEESNTRYAQGGIAVALAPGDSPELHLRDTIAAGDGLCDAESVAVLTNEAAHCIRDLLARGVPFDRDGDELAWTREAAHTLPRVLHAGGDATGAGIEHTLAGEVREAGISIEEHAFCTSLLVEGGSVCGVRLLSRDGGWNDVRAHAVVLATGGAGQLYARTTNPAIATGDGQAIAYRAGALLADLEFMQFHPTALHIDGAPPFLVSEAVRGEGGILRDARGIAFMKRYHSDGELAPRDVVARAIHRQMALNGEDHVYLDIRHLSAATIERRFPTIVAFSRHYGIDPVRDLMPVSPAAHYWMGGIWTDSWGRTTLPGLYACGEVACTQAHGANRLASNSLLEGLVFARRVAVAVAGGVDDRTPRAMGMSLVSATPAGMSGAPIDRSILARVMWDHVSVERSEVSLSEARRAIDRAVSSTGLAEALDSRARAVLEARNLTLLSSLLIHAASLRTESRGGHFRADFPEPDGAWRGHIAISLEGTRYMPLESRVPVTGGEPQLCA